MSKEEIEVAFNSFLWRMNAIDSINEETLLKLKIAFTEGILLEQESFIKKLKK